VTRPRRAFFDSPLGQAHYIEAGPREGTPTVLLHQTPRSTDEFAEALPLLAVRRRVIALDTPGYGCSDRVAGEPQVADYAGVVRALLDHLGVAQADLVGHHTGANVAIECAAAWPDRVRRLVLSGPMYLDEQTRLELAPQFQQWAPDPAGLHLIEKWNRMAAWTSDRGLLQRLVVDLFRAGEHSEQGHFAIAAYRMEDRVSMVKCPVLLIYGEGDPFATPEANRRRMRSALPQVREVLLKGGVFLPNEAPEAFASATLDFLESCSP